MFNHVLSYNYIRGVPKGIYDKEPTKKINIITKLIEFNEVSGF